MRQKLVIYLLAGAMALLSACAGQAETSWAVTEGTQQSCARLLYPARL